MKNIYKTFCLIALFSLTALASPLFKDQDHSQTQRNVELKNSCQKLLSSPIDELQAEEKLSQSKRILAEVVIEERPRKTKVKVQQS